jgi:epoxyqueuosine reductase
LENKLSGWIYGCDICQEVCPWNITFSQLSNENSFQPRDNLKNRKGNEWEKLTEEEFRILFKKSAVKRTKFSGLRRNISLLGKNSSKNPN